MSMKDNLPYVAALVLSAVVIARARRKSHPPLPPSPPAEPLLGHARLIPDENQEHVFYELGKQYGEIVYLRIPGKDMIVLNSTEAAIDLLEKRSALYSDRGDTAVFDLMGWTELGTTTFLKYGKRFQVHRRLFQDYLAQNKIQDYERLLVIETNVLLQNLLRDDVDRDKYIERFATSSIVNVAYGFRIESDKDEYLKIASGIKHVLSNSGSPGGSIIDLLPFLKYFPSWFPGTHYATFARKHRHYVEAMFNYPYKKVKEAMAAGRAKPSFLSSHLEGLHREGDNYKYRIEEILGVAGTMYAGGAETTSSALSSFFYAMTLYPEVQKRAQEEIDSVTHSTRLPTFQDREDLPYVEAIFREVSRCYPVIPMGVPHVSTEEDVYKGMYIPKGTMIIANTRGMTLDEKVYADPLTFDPTRFLQAPEGRNEPFPISIFGFGRRICPGKYLAESSVWFAMVSVLATMSISKARDKEGKEITPGTKFESGIASHPAPFQCVVRPRSKAAQDLIEQAPIWDSE